MDAMARAISALVPIFEHEESARRLPHTAGAARGRQVQAGSPRVRVRGPHAQLPTAGRARDRRRLRPEPLQAHEPLR
jgi:hypothetical protein